MSEAVPVNVQSFAPFQGGNGKRLAVTGSSASAAIPGLAGGTPAPNARVLVTNGGSTSIFVRLGDQNVVATTDSLEILPGCAYLLTPPFSGLGGVYLAAISLGDSTNVGVMFGEGT